MRALWPLQKALFQRLNTLNIPVYDEVHDLAVLPYIRLGEDTSVYWGSKTFNGEEATHTLHIFSSYKGKKEVKEIISQITEVLDQPLQLESGFVIRLSNVEMAEVFEEDDGRIKHGVMRIRFNINKE